MLWNNKDVMYQGQVVYFKDWIAGGIMDVHDIVTESGTVSYQHIL